MNRIEEIGRALAELHLKRLSIEVLIERSQENMTLDELQKAAEQNDCGGLYDNLVSLDSQIDELLDILVEICNGPGTENKSGVILTDITYKDTNFE